MALLSSESIWFGTETTKVEPNNKVKLQEILRPLHLFLDQYFSSRKILKVFMIYNNINKKDQIFKILSPNFECLKNDKNFLIMHVIVQLHYSTRVKDNQMNFIFFIHN